MEKIGILVVSYGSRDAAIIDSLSNSREYEVNLYIADKQRNPFNIKRTKAGGEHRVIPDLSIREISRFAQQHRDEIRFGIVGSEVPIIQGLRNLLEKETKIPIICPTKEYAIEASKVSQRILLQKCWPEANPQFKVFDPKKMGPNPRSEFEGWVRELGGPTNIVIKPDRPGYGKGVGVGGEHFKTLEEAYAYFSLTYGGEGNGKVIVEERIEGEESSFQTFCDGKHLATLPETRDYKRAFEGDRGPNTGGMGSYKGEGKLLPFMEESDREAEERIVESIFRELGGEGSNPNLRGVPFYVAFMHSTEGPKILEINSRPGDPEIQNILPLIEQDFVELCLKMIDGELHSVKLKRQASVVIYKVPPTYGEYNKWFPERAAMEEADSPIYLDEALSLVEGNDNLRLYPGSLELRPDKNIYSLRSRTVCSVGIAEDLEEARDLSLMVIRKIRGGGLWYRGDIASKEHIGRSLEHMRRLRGK
ncbi:MAG: ATP-grasp domain-containing protein [Candidatus Bathyarchaeia archaeon]